MYQQEQVQQKPAHEEVFGLERLYELCKICYELVKPYHIARVIARPFVGTRAEDACFSPNTPGKFPCLIIFSTNSFGKHFSCCGKYPQSKSTGTPDMNYVRFAMN